jgi:hypothetical protein
MHMSWTVKLYAAYLKSISDSSLLNAYVRHTLTNIHSDICIYVTKKMWKFFHMFCRFNCILCLCPRLEMVVGHCQHRVCCQCVYNKDGLRKPSLDKCPTCQREDAFPVIRYITVLSKLKIVKKKYAHQIIAEGGWPGMVFVLSVIVIM